MQLKAPLSFEMLLSQFQICLLSENNSFKNMEIHSFFGPFPRFPVHFLESDFALEHEI